MNYLSTWYCPSKAASIPKVADSTRAFFSEKLRRYTYKALCDLTFQNLGNTGIVRSAGKIMDLLTSSRMGELAYRDEENALVLQNCKICHKDLN